MTIKHVFTKGAIYTDNDFAVRVLSRKGDFVSFKNLGNDKTFRRKVKVTYVSGESYEALNICKDWDKGFPVSFLVIARGILPEFTEQVIANAKHWYEMMYADDDSQPELPENYEITTSANDNDNALASQPAAIATAECETSAQPKIVKFVVGKTYACIHSVCGMDWTGYKKNNYLCKYTIIARKGKFVTVRDELGDTAKRLLKTDNNGVEFIHPSGYYASFKHLVLFANATTVEPEITPTAESSRPENLYMDDSFSDAPGDNSDNARNQDFPVDIPECTPDEIAQQEKYAFIIGNVYISPDNRPFTVINRSENFIILADEHGKTLTRKIYTSSYCEAVRLEKFTVGSLFLSAISLKKNNMSADNPGFTIVPSEHIERPQYTAYPDTITDECPYVTVPACDIPENHSSAAVVPYADFAHIRNFFRLIALYLRLWLAMNITPNKNPLDDFPDGLFTHYATRKKPRAKFRRAVFEVGSSYSASSYSTSKGLQSFTFLVTGRCVYEDTYNKRKNVMLFITCNSPDNHDFEGRGVIRFIDTDHGVEVYNDRRYYEMGCGWRVFSFRADKRDNVPFPFKNTTPGDPNYKPCGNATRFLSREFLNYSDNPDPVQEIHAETREITPKSAPQTLTCFSAYIDWKYRNVIRRKNKAIIDACNSEEEIIALMLTLDSTSLLNQANYCKVKLHTNIPHSSEIKTDEQLAREFAAAIIARRAKKARKAEKLQTSKISPDPASATADIEHKLIDTQNLHFAEKRKALEHNATVITSCMFPEAVIFLLLSISAKAVIQLGFHMGLFVAKPKGSKKAIAESFAERLITRRDILANVRTKSTNTAANNTANVPDGVKIFIGARRQICFKFED